MMTFISMYLRKCALAMHSIDKKIRKKKQTSNWFSGRNQITKQVISLNGFIFVIFDHFNAKFLDRLDKNKMTSVELQSSPSPTKLHVDKTISLADQSEVIQHY